MLDLGVKILARNLQKNLLYFHSRLFVLWRKPVVFVAQIFVCNLNLLTTLGLVYEEVTNLLLRLEDAVVSFVLFVIILQLSIRRLNFFGQLIRGHHYV